MQTSFIGQSLKTAAMLYIELFYKIEIICVIYLDDF